MQSQTSVYTKDILDKLEHDILPHRVIYCVDLSRKQSGHFRGIQATIKRAGDAFSDISFYAPQDFPDGEMETLLSLYRTYEFSGRFHVLSDAGQYGTLCNYLETGLLTAEELLEAIQRTGGRERTCNGPTAL